MEVTNGAGRLDLRGDRQRAFVAFLALEPGRVRRVEGIVEALWDGGDLPADPRQSLHTWASRSRGVLGEDRIVARDGGYVLVVEPEDLWHGHALEGFDSVGWALPVAHGLEERRAVAEDARGDALIELERAELAVPALEAAAARSPLRERTHQLLMTALYRSGRQAEALRVYQRYRTRLATDLGLEPGEGLVALERQIAHRAAALSRRDPLGSARGYVLQERIGEGAFAVVYRATQPAVERDVAVKVIRAEFANRPEFIRRFEAEAQLVARLEHPYIVPLYDYWRDPGSAYLVMRLFREGTLEDRIVDGPVSLGAIERMVTQVGGALAVAHRHGVVHRDVKSANVFVDDDGNYFLGDFGIAYVDAAPPSTIDSLSVGSPAYAAPEQLRRGPVGPAADVHGLAITVFEAVAGHLPFHDAANQAELLRRQLNEPLPSLRSLRPEVPLALERVLERATDKDPARRHESAQQFVDEFVAALHDENRVAPRPGAATVIGDLRNPYKGLLAFQEADAADFFGRQRLVERLLAHLRARDGSDRLLAVVGPSGSGKSSVVRAGLMPALRRGAIAGSDRWFATSMVPGAHPFEELEAALGRVATGPITGLSELMSADRRGIARAVKLVVPEGNEALLVIDQFEELFTLCPDDSVRQRFVSGLAAALTDPRSRLRVVMTLRADFYDRPLRYPEFASIFERSAVAVTPLAADELERAIVEPAARCGVDFEPGLVARVVADVVDQPGALPLLQYALTELFDRRSAAMMHIDDYAGLGGLTGALARRGESLHDEASEAEQNAIRRVFVRLVSLGEGTEDTRRRATLSELGDDPATTAVVDGFGAARLLAFDRDPSTRERTVEVAHEALLRQWPRLREWLDEDRDGLRLHRHLTAAARGWTDRGRDAGELYRGARLEAARAWAADHEADLNDAERMFLAASVDAHHRAVEAEERAARRLRRSLAAVAAVAVLAVIAGSVAVVQQRSAAQARDRAARAAVEASNERDTAEDASAEAETERANAVVVAADSETGRMAAVAPDLADTDLALALLLAAEANHRSDDPRTLGALQGVLASAGNTLGFIPLDLRGTDDDGNTIRIQGLGSTGDGDLVVSTTTQLLVISAEDGAVQRRIDVAGQGQDPNGGLLSNSFSARGDTAAWIDTDDQLWLADLSTGEVANTGLDSVAGVDLEADGTHYVIARDDGVVERYRLGASSPDWTLAGDGLVTVADVQQRTAGNAGTAAVDRDVSADLYPTDLEFTPDGSLLFASRGYGVRVIDPATGAPLTVLEVSSEFAMLGQKVSVLGDGSGRIMVADLFSVAIADARTGAVTPVDVSLRNVSDTFNGAFALDDRFVVQHLVGEFTVVDADGRVLGDTFDPGVGRLYGEVASADGSTLYALGETGIAKLAPDGSGLLHRSLDAPIGFGSVTAAPDGDVLFLGDVDERTRPPRRWSCDWSRAEPCEEVTITETGGSTVGVPVDRDTFVAREFGATPSARVYDTTTAQPVSVEITPSSVYLSQFVPADRTWIAVTTLFPPVLEVYALPNGEPLASLPLDDFVILDGAPQPDRLIAHNLYTGDAQVVNTRTWTFEASSLEPASVIAARFSTDGSLLATVGQNGEVVIRDGRTFDRILTITGDGGVSGALFGLLAFSDDNRYLLSAVDGRAQLWDVASGAPIGQPISLGHRINAVAFPGEAVGFTGIVDGRVEIWWLDPSTWRDLACRAAGRNLTLAEWEQYGPEDEPYHQTCAQWPSP